MFARRWAAALLLLAAVAAAPGCMGRMVVTKGAYQLNMRAVENRWGREVLFLGMLIVPVYEFCFFVDLFAINAIEFWQGKNPVSGERAVVDVSPD